MHAILGEKVGMTAIFNEDGTQQIPVTIVKTAGVVVVGKRTEAKDGYNAVILGIGCRPAKRAGKAVVGQFASAGLVETCGETGKQYVKRFVREIRVTADELAKFEVGNVVKVSDLFHKDDVVDVIATSKGNGFSGVMRRHNFHGYNATHGQHEYYRHGGAISSNTYPAHVFKNVKMPGQCGNVQVTIQNLSVVDVKADDDIILIHGGIPGPNGGLVHIRRAIKKRHHNHPTQNA